MKRKGWSGWYGNKERHSLASKGIKTVTVDNHFNLMKLGDRKIIETIMETVEFQKDKTTKDEWKSLLDVETGTTIGNFPPSADEIDDVNTYYVESRGGHTAYFETFEEALMEAQKQIVESRMV